MLADRVLYNYSKRLIPYKEELLYLESKGSGKTSLSLDFNPKQVYENNNNMRIDMKFLYTSSGGNYLYGTINSYFSFEKSYSDAYFNIGSTTIRGSINVSLNTPCAISALFNNGNLSVSGDKSATDTFSGTLPDNNLNLFGAKLNEANVAGTRCYYFKVYDNETLIYDYIPVLDIDDRPCMYDTVNGIFKYSIGSEDFNYGRL